ncbi:MAG: hypothetical protein NT150_02175 [Bacteroidetes bacterium]|nr:hypothetical protein [Bacteroidota bacterium]
MNNRFVFGADLALYKGLFLKNFYLKLLILGFIFSSHEMRSNNDSLKVDFNYRFIKAWSITPLASINVSPVGICPISYDSKGYTARTYTIIGIWYHRHFRYNLYEFNNEKAIGINLSPSLGAVPSMNSDMDGLGVGHFTLPLYFSYEWGAGSTYNSKKKLGYSLGIGLEYQLLPLFYLFVNKEDHRYVARNFIVPIITFTTRKWDDYYFDFKTRNYKLGILPYSYTNYEYNNILHSIVFTFSFSFGAVLDRDKFSL